MALCAGRVLLPDGVQEGWFEADAGRITACGSGRPEGRPDVQGWIVPAPVNAHTHVGDAALAPLPKPTQLAELVGPGGWKHQHLARLSRADMQAGIRSWSVQAAATGTDVALDFREGGAAGLDAVAGLDVDAPSFRWFARPRGADLDEDEVDAVVARADGVGLSALRDMPGTTAEAWADAAHDHKVPLALHVSEGRHEHIEEVLALAPRFVVHACKATKRDIGDIRDAGVEVVVCPRSNARFGLRADVRAMLEEGIHVALGTDNAMLQDGDIWAEARMVMADAGIPEETALRMATYHGRSLAGLKAPAWKPGATGWVVLPSDILQKRSKPGFTGAVAS